MRSQRKTCSSSAGVLELDPGAGKDEIDLWHGTSLCARRSGTQAPAPVASSSCASVCSTSAPTRAICWWSTPTVAPRRCRRPPYKESLRLAEHLDKDGTVSEKGVDALTEFVGHALEARGGQGVRGDLLLRHLGGPRRRQLRRGARPRREAHRGRHQGAAGRGRGTADLPRRTPLVRVVLGPARRLRHRGRLARDRRRRRRVARRGLVAAAGRGPAEPRALRRRASRATRRCASCASRSGRTSPTRPGRCCDTVRPHHAVATSKTFRSLARICGAAPSSDGLFVRRVLPAADLERVDPQAARR